MLEGCLRIAALEVVFVSTASFSPRELPSMLRKWNKEKESPFEPAFKVNTLTIAFFAHARRCRSRKSHIFSQSEPD